MQTMQRELVVQTAYEIQEIIKEPSLQTLQVYLDNYKFDKHRIDKERQKWARYKINNEFLSLLYTTLLRRNRIKAANRLKAYFNTYKIKNIDLEI